MDAEVEALICELRRQHPRWGACRVRHELGRRNVDKIPSRATVHRVLSRNGLINAQDQQHKRNHHGVGERGTGDRSGCCRPDARACGKGAPNLENRVEADAPAGGAANQSNGSSVDCPAAGALQPTDDALCFYYTQGNDGVSWTFLRNQRTGVRGWVRDSLLDVKGDGRTRGSIELCGF